MTLLEWMVQEGAGKGIETASLASRLGVAPGKIASIVKRAAGVTEIGSRLFAKGDDAKLPQLVELDELLAKPLPDHAIADHDEPFGHPDESAV